MVSNSPRTLDAEWHNVNAFVHDTVDGAKTFNITKLLDPTRFIALVFDFFYVLVQRVIIWVFMPPPPPSPDIPFKPRGRIAVIGGGLTGVSTAAHAIAHGFDVVLYEADSKIGGIWSRVNATSGLQLNSLLYRFHPAVLWSRAFPQRDEILGEIKRVHELYGVGPRTRLNARVVQVRRATADDFESHALPAHVASDADNVDYLGEQLDLDPKQRGHGRWYVKYASGEDEREEGPFDAVVANIGTCGDPMRIPIPGMPGVRREEQNGKEGGGGSETSEGEGGEQEEEFRNPILHSSELDDADLDGKRIVVVGSGASGVEAVETALSRGAKSTVMLARDDKWIIPRNVFLDTLVSAQPFGREMPLSFVWEKIITWLNYRGVRDLVPARLGLFESTPVVNDEFLGHVRAGRCKYVRGDTKYLKGESLVVSVRSRESKPGDPGREEEFPADVLVLATGFKKPEVKFLPDDLFPEGYERPNLYLQNFATEDWSVLMTNSAYQNAIGTVGHFHIGIYTRILLTFLMDKDSRPSPKDMKLWVDVLRFVKRGAKGGALGFFTYMELTIWVVLFHFFRLDRLRWLFFIMQGWGVYPEGYDTRKTRSAAEAFKWAEKEMRPIREHL